jgi:hypothetical protein
MITRELINSAYTYEQYMTLMTNLVQGGKTTGTKQSEDDKKYTVLNLQRMNRIYKTTNILPELVRELSSINRKLIWLVITESWCGDTAQVIPVFAKMADVNTNIELRMILRDENPDVMNMFLTNGGRAIPVVIVLDALTLEVLGRWGARPAPAQGLSNELKANPGISYEERSKQIQLWYAKDKTVTIQKEFTELLKNIKHESIITLTDLK